MEKDKVKVSVNPFVTREIALRMKEAGFNEPCIAFFNGKADVPTFVNQENVKVNKGYWCKQDGETNFGCEFFDCLPAPLWQEAEQWLRDSHDFDISIYPEYYSVDGVEQIYKLYRDKEEIHTDSFYWDYPQAREAAILKALDLIENN